MLPQKSLRELVPTILEYIATNKESLVDYQKKLLDIHKGNLLKYVEDSLKPELSARALQKSLGRIPPINILSQVVDKLSKVYVEPAVRDAGDNVIDGELLSYYEQELDVDNQLSIANELLNLNKYFAIEPYLDPYGVPDMRILPADKFLVWGDYPQDPTVMTVFIKFMGSIRKEVGPAVDERGVALKGAQNSIRDVALFHLYTDDTFLVVDMDGEVHDEQPNPYGVIPFVYGSNSTYDLVPIPDSDNYAMAVTVPKLLTDLNYAIQFQSHSVMYGIDINMNSSLEMNPDAFWDLSSKEGENRNPTIGTIKPEIDSDKVLGVINAEVGMWLDSKGLKTSGIGAATVQTAVSGVAKMIDNADASASHRKQNIQFRKVEENLWQLIKTMHHFWITGFMMKDQVKDFSPDFKPVITFADAKVVVDTKATLEELKIMFDLNLTNRKMALSKLYPTLTDAELDQMIEDIDAEKVDNVNRFADVFKAAQSNDNPEEEKVEEDVVEEEVEEEIEE